MPKYIHKIVEYGLYLFVFLLPWQTRWMWQEGFLKGEHWEYGTFSLYGADMLLVVIFLLSLFLPKKQPKGAERFWVLILGFFLISFASIFWSQNKELAWYAAAKLAEGLLLFWLVIRLSVNWRAIGMAIVSSGVVQAILGIYQFFLQQIVASKWLGLAAHDPGTLGDFVVETGSGRFLRAYGSLPHPNMLAGFLVVCLIILMGFILSEHRERRGRAFVVILYSAAFAIMFFGVVLTFSRTAWLAFVATLVLMFCASAWQRDRYRLFTLTRVCTWVLLLIVFSIALLPSLWQTRVITGGRLETMSTAQRTSYFAQARDIVRENWLQGVGIGNYTQALYNQDSSKDAWDYQPAHNIFLLVTAETGVFGGLVFIFLTFEFLRASVSVVKKRGATVDDWFLVYSLTLLALLLIGLFDHYLWSLSFGILFFWLVFGLWVKQWLGNGELTFDPHSTIKPSL